METVENAGQVPPVEKTETETAPIDESVPKQAYEQVKQDLFKFKDQAKKLQEDIDRMKVNTLKEKQDWEQIAKINEEKAAEYEQKYNGLSRSLIENAKLSKINEAARKAGIMEQSLADLELLDFPEVHVETTSGGKILVSGHEQAIESLRKRRPHWFSSKPAPVNPTTPSTLTPANGQITLADLAKLEAEYQKNPQNKLAAKAYSDAIAAYKKSNP